MVLGIPQMTLLSWLVVGAIAGFLASVITGSREGLLMMVVLGIVGAIVGGWVATDILKIADVTGVNMSAIPRLSRYSWHISPHAWIAAGRSGYTRTSSCPRLGETP